MKKRIIVGTSIDGDAIYANAEIITLHIKFGKYRDCRENDVFVERHPRHHNFWTEITDKRRIREIETFFKK